MKGRNNFDVIFVMMSLDKTLNKHTKIIHEGKNVKFVILTLEKREL